MAATQTEVLAPFKPLPWQIPAFRDKSPVMLLTGSAGGGKSRLASEKLHAYMLKYPGAVGLAMRKTRRNARISVVKAMEHAIGGDPHVRYHGTDSAFYYDNGSVLYIGGMADQEQREAIRSINGDGSLDIVWFEEATAFVEDDFNEILGRMRGRAASWMQIILSTNPEGPLHWIKRRLIDGREASLYMSSEADNPHNPPEYRQNLSKLTGVQYERLVRGLWVQAEGVVYDNWRDAEWPEGNVSPEAVYHPEWPLEWFVDDGYAHGQGQGSASYHPRVILVAQIRPDGGIDIIDEDVVTGEVYGQTFERLLGEGAPYRRPRIAYVDSSASVLRAELSTRGIPNQGATHPVTEGIKNVRRFICDGSGMRLLRVHPRCQNLIFEMVSYQYADANKASGGEPKPVKANDHSVDALRYGLWPKRYAVT